MLRCLGDKELTYTDLKLENILYKCVAEGKMQLILGDLGGINQNKKEYDISDTFSHSYTRNRYLSFLVDRKEIGGIYNQKYEKFCLGMMYMNMLYQIGMQMSEPIQKWVSDKNNWKYGEIKLPKIIWRLIEKPGDVTFADIENDINWELTDVSPLTI